MREKHANEAERDGLQKHVNLCVMRQKVGLQRSDEKHGLG